MATNERVVECLDCGALIYLNDSDLICTKCGGQNRRAPQDLAFLTGRIVWIAGIVGIWLLVAWAVIAVFI